MRSIAIAALACIAAGCREKGDVRGNPVIITVDAGAVGREIEQGAKEMGRRIEEGAGRALEETGREMRSRGEPDAGPRQSQ